MEPNSQPQQGEQPQKPSIPTPPPSMVIRTFQSDAAQAIQKKNVSLATIALAENMRKQNKSMIGGPVAPVAAAQQQREEARADAESSHAGKKLIIGLLGVIFLAAGVFGGYYLYTKSALAPVTIKPIPQEKQGIPSIVTADNQKILDITGQNIAGTLTTLHQATQQESEAGKMTEYIFTTKTEEKTTQIGGSDIIKRLGLNAPDMFIRSLTPQWMFGTYQGGKQEQFFIFTNNYFQSAYSGMIKWEATMADSLATVFTFPQPLENSTTSKISEYFSIKGTFVDGVIKNKDVRSFKNDAGQTLFLYTFIDQNTIVITTSESALLNILERIEKKTYVR